MGEEFQASKPIYMQIADKINKKIVRNELHLGDKLPSVREMAIQTGVNPNTIQRAYSELERMEIVETKRGQGTFVIENEQIIKKLKHQLQIEIISKFIYNMKELGYLETELVESLKSFIDEGQGRME